MARRSAQTVRFLHTADWQLGMTRHFLEGEAQPRYTAARQDAIREIARVARDTGAQFVVVCGDVFEHNQLSPRVVSRSLEAMKEFDVPVYLLPGNHDPLDASSIYSSAIFVQEKPDHVHVLDSPGPHLVLPGVELVAAPWESKRPLSDLVGDQVRQLEFGDVVRIVVGHGAVDAINQDKSLPSLISLDNLESALDGGLIDYVALGDKHSRTQVGSTGAVWYSGAHVVTNFDDIEHDPGHVLVVDVAIDEAGGSTATVEPHSVGDWTFLTLVGDVNGGADIESLDGTLGDYPNKDRTVVRLALKGTLTVRQKAALDQTLDSYVRRFAALSFWERQTDLAIAPQDGEFSDLGVGGFAADAVQELSSAATGGGAGAEAAQGALSLLYRLAGGSARATVHR